MNTADIEELQRVIINIRDSFEQLCAPALAPIGSTASAEDLRVAGMRESQEAQNKKYLIEPMLQALGWDVNDPRFVVVEHEVPPLPQGGIVSIGESRFLDYHCRISDSVVGQQSLAIAEAKRLSASLPVPQASGSLEHSTMFARALERRLVHEESALPRYWSTWLDSIVDYARRVQHVTGSPPKRAVITNGNWYVVFANPDTSLANGPPSSGDIFIFRDLAEVHVRAKQFYELLSYSSLRGDLPPQHPSKLSELAAPGERVSCTMVACVDYKPFGRRQPLLAIAVRAWVRVPEHGWLMFEMDFGDDFIPLRSGTQDLAPLLAQLSRRKDLLLAEIRRYVSVEMIAPEILTPERPAVQQPLDSRALQPERLVCKTSAQQYLLAVGENFAHITSDVSYDACPYHSHGQCQSEGSAATGTPILHSSIAPIAFFPSGSAYHCAHRSVHEQRIERCLLRAFERHLCCRRCAFVNVCWPDGGNSLPCTK